MVEQAEAKKQIGLTSAGSDALKELYEESRFFASETDAYKLAVAYTLAKGFDPHDAANRWLYNKVQCGWNARFRWPAESACQCSAP